MKIIQELRRDWPMATEIHKLEARIWQQIAVKGIQVLLVTSPQRGEGKSTTVAHLAAAMALHPGRRILVVDLDFRDPKLNDYFELDVPMGMADVLRGDCQLEDAILKTDLPTLDLILPGNEEEEDDIDRFRDPNLLLNSPELYGVFAKLREQYDVILVDVPALIPVADTSAVIPLADSVVLALMAGRTTKSHLARAREICLGMGVEILGIVVSNAQEAAPEHMEYGYYGYTRKRRDKRDREFSS